MKIEIPREIEDLLMTLGKVEWGATAPLDAEGHAESVRKSVEATAQHFNQTEPQPMNGLYLVTTDVVVCHTGTSPNSANIARALTGAWNRLVDECEQQWLLRKQADA